MKAGVSAIVTWALPLAILLLACIAVFTDPAGLASRVRALEFDTYQRARPRVLEDTQVKTGHTIKVLDVDAASLAKFGPWPWPRTVLAQLIGDLKAQGASLVVVDLPLDEADPMVTLTQALPKSPQAAALRAQLAALPSPDDALAVALASMPSVTGFTLGESGHATAVKAQITISGATGAVKRVRTFAGASGALPRIDAASAGRGALNLPLGADGEVRNVPLMFNLAGKPVPGLDAEVLRLVAGAPDLDVTTAEAGFLGLR